MILLTTVWHTGTHSLRAQLPGEVKWLHCCQEAVELALGGDYETLTTYRDPRETALSWLRRSNTIPSDVWREQWRAWDQISRVARVYRMSELETRLASYDTDPAGHPLDADIEYALDCSAWYRLSKNSGK